MVIELTAQEKSTDLSKMLFELDKRIDDKESTVFERLLADTLRGLVRQAIYYKAMASEAAAAKAAACEEADRLKQQLDTVLGDLNDITKDRDELASEVNDIEWSLTTPFEQAMFALEGYHDALLAEISGYQAGDPFGHMAVAKKHEMAEDSFPLIEIEAALGSDKPRDTLFWTEVAHQAVLALSYHQQLDERDGEQGERFAS